MSSSADGSDAERADGSVDCSVLVPVLNEAREIVDCVSVMLRQRFPGRLEFLLIDGGSTDGTGELLQRLARSDARIRLLENPRGATPSSLNVGLRFARGAYVARMDAHTRYPEDYLANGVARLARGDTRWVSGPQLPVGQTPISRAVAVALRTPLGRGGSRRWGSGDGAAEYELDSGVFTGVWKRTTLLEYGGWDERWLRNQDSELAGRFLASGERLVCLPEMGAGYTPRSSLKALWRQYFQYGIYREKTAVRHPDTMRRSHLLAPALVVTAGAALAPVRPLRRLARLGLSIYAAALGGAGVRGLSISKPRREAALVPIVLSVMHAGHGMGMLTGAVRDAPPLAAVFRLIGLTRLAKRFSSPGGEVFAPSLSPDGAITADAAGPARSHHDLQSDGLR